MSLPLAPHAGSSPTRGKSQGLLLSGPCDAPCVETLEAGASFWGAWASSEPSETIGPPLTAGLLGGGTAASCPQTRASTRHLTCSCLTCSLFGSRVRSGCVFKGLPSETTSTSVFMCVPIRHQMAAAPGTTFPLSSSDGTIRSGGWRPSCQVGDVWGVAVIDSQLLEPGRTSRRERALSQPSLEGRRPRRATGRIRPPQALRISVAPDSRHVSGVCVDAFP